MDLVKPPLLPSCASIIYGKLCFADDFVKRRKRPPKVFHQRLMDFCP